MDDALVGLAGGLLVLLYEQRQRRNIIKKLEVIRQMNHHVRNSLQVISLAASAPQPEQTEELLQGAVERIEWALREVLPGEAICLSFLDPRNLPLKRTRDVGSTERPDTFSQTVLVTPILLAVLRDHTCCAN